MKATEIKAERATIFVNHPLFNAVVSIHNLERRACIAEARVKELDDALAVACERYRKCRKSLKKLRLKNLAAGRKTKSWRKP